MGEQIEGPVRELLAAVVEALDIPHPATVGDSERYRQLLEDRAMHAVIALRGVLADGGFPLGIEWVTGRLRARLAEHPPTGYRHAGGER